MKITSVVKNRRTLAPLIIASLTLLFPLALWLWRQHHALPLLVISADDLHRALYTWQVTQGQPIPSDLWPPLQFWVQALALRLSGSLLTAPLLTNLVASTAMLCCLLLLGRLLGLRSVGLIFLGVLVVTLPWYVWLSVSGLSEPLFFLGIGLAYLGVLRWRSNENEWGLWVAACALLAAGLVRFDAWGYSVVFSAAVVWFWWRGRAPRPHRWLLAALIPLLCIAGWLSYMLLKYGHVFYFADVTRNYYLVQHQDNAASLWQRITWQPLDLWEQAGITLVLALIGLWMMRHKQGVLLLSLMWLSGLALLMRSTFDYVITQNNPERLVTLPVLLLAPGAALTLQAIWQQRAGRVVALSLLLAVVAPRLFLIPGYPTIFSVAPEGIPVRAHLADLRAQQVLQPDDRILIEVVFWDYILLHAMTEDPAAVVYDREPTLIMSPEGNHTLDDENNPSLLDQPSAALRSALHASQVRVVIARSSHADAAMGRIAEETLHYGNFSVFVLPRPASQADDAP